MNEIKTVVVDGDLLEVIAIDGKGWVTLRSLLAPFGKEVEKQVERLQAWADLRKELLRPRSGSTDLRGKFAWLVSAEHAPMAIAELDSRGMPDALRAKHAAYKRECAAALHAHFVGTVDSADQRDLVRLSLLLEPSDASTIWERETVQELCRVCRQAIWTGGPMPAWLRGPMGLIYKIVLGEIVYAELHARNPEPRGGSLNYQFLTEARHRLMQNDMGTVSALLRMSRSSEEFFNRLRFAYRRGPLQLAW